MNPEIKKFFNSINIYISAGYGMSETAGIVTTGNKKAYKSFDEDFYLQTGVASDGMTIKIVPVD